jgi:hypothetical protein
MNLCNFRRDPPACTELGKDPLVAVCQELFKLVQVDGLALADAPPEFLHDKELVAEAGGQQQILPSSQPYTPDIQPTVCVCTRSAVG